MKIRNLAIAATSAVALIGVTACTPEQVQRVQTVIDTFEGGEVPCEGEAGTCAPQTSTPVVTEPSVPEGGGPREGVGEPQPGEVILSECQLNPQTEGCGEGGR